MLAVEITIHRKPEEKLLKKNQNQNIKKITTRQTLKRKICNCQILYSKFMENHENEEKLAFHNLPHYNSLFALKSSIIAIFVLSKKKQDSAAKFFWRNISLIPKLYNVSFFESKNLQSTRFWTSNFRDL